MRRALANLAGFGLGTTLGGLLVGVAEGLYRGVSPGYAALLYGALWAAAGFGLAAFLSPLWRAQPVPTKQVRWGLVLSLGSSSLVLVRFIVLRDILHESQGGQMIAFAAGFGAAVLVSIPVLFLARGLRRRLVIDHLFGPPVWVVPLVVVAVFALRAQAGDDELPETPPPPKPLAGTGVILVVADALRADALGAYGAGPHRDRPASPHFDALAASGLLFEDASAQASWTRPAVASLLTSRHVSGHATMSKAAVLPEALPTIATRLSEAGVATAAVVTNYNLEESYGFARGFDTYRYLDPARYLGAPERANRLAAYNVYRLLRERLFKGRREARHFYRSGKAVNALGLDTLDHIGNGRFFLWLHYMEPHDPFFDIEGNSFARVSDPHPPASWAPRMHDAYRDDVHRFDAVLGELAGAVAARGLADRVTLVVVADHGEEFAEHNGFYHGVTLYEEQLHVPLWLGGPGIVPGVSSALARQIDVAPTILARFGVAPPASWEGRDLLGDTPPPAMTLAEEDHEGNVLTSLREGGHKLIIANPDNPRGLAPVELYDLDADPDERTNLGTTDARAAPLRSKLEAAVEAARQGGATATTRALDADAEAELRSLGYVQ